MILGYHVIFCAYGFWLPNDPRGSWSDFVRSYELWQHGAATKTDTRRSVAARDHDHSARLAAKQSLKHQPVLFTGLQARAIAMGFASFVAKSGLIIHACAIMPDHVHLAVARHRYRVEQAVNLLKGAATTELKRQNLAPPSPPWAQGLWKVFLDIPADLARAIHYVQANPPKAGLPPQHWSFVVPYDG
jgi:REP element-mobilizing transposase RayT